MKKLLKTIAIALLLYLLLGGASVIVLKSSRIEWTPLMVKRAIEYRNDDSYSRHQKYVPVDSVSDAFLKAVIAAEDAGFYSHNGFESDEIRSELERLKNGERDIRGCSTISQQTAKNVFTLGSPTWLRKGVEAWFTFLIEKLWGKDKILEVYINVAEFGKGIYGVQAAAEYYLNTDASKLTLADATSLALCLPSPLTRTPDDVNKRFAKRRNQIARDAKLIALQ
jgi:monofunctional biosynthetic peptidoglycan transglycosylase